MDTLSADSARSNQPLVSVVMSVYNGERFLRESIDSILAQTHQNLELVLVNDGSQDRTRVIVASYRDPRIRFIDRTENWGLTRSLNEGLQHARGEYIARLDAGDTALPHRVAAQVAFLAQHPEVGILGSGIVLFANQQTLREYTYTTLHAEIADLLFRFVNPMPHSTLMFRRAVIEQLGGYCPQFLRSQDYDLLLRATTCTRLASLPEVLVRWRFDPSSLTYGSATQLTYGIAALVRAQCLRCGRYDVIADAHWQSLLQCIRQFVRRHHLDRKMGSAKPRLLAELAYRERRWLSCMVHGLHLLLRHPGCWWNTRTRVSAFIADHWDEVTPPMTVCGAR
ncbi:glycosyltransferase [Candidatus Uhrbacteria bacterium]|nr:glycosyltransferase [Candidatus Uhrbacteria bacterium]